MSASTERKQSLEVAPRITSIFWEFGQSFDSSRVDLFLDRDSIPVDHEVFGKGHHWKLGMINGLHTKLDFYPKTPALNLTYRDSRGETQPRFYIVDAVGIGEYQGKNYVAFLSEKDMTSEIVLIAQDGNFSEFHQRFDFISSPAGTNKQIQDALLPHIEDETEQQSTHRKLTQGVSELLHKRPQEYSPEDILKIFKLMNPHTKNTEVLGLQTRFSELAKAALANTDLESLDNQVRLAYTYLELRFVKRFDTMNVARNLGYSREHVSREIQPQARHLLYTLLRLQSATVTRQSRKG